MKENNKGILIRGFSKETHEVLLAWEKGCPVLPAGTVTTVRNAKGVSCYFKTTTAVIEFVYELPVSPKLNVLVCASSDKETSSTPLRWVRLDAAIELLKMSGSADYELLMGHITETLHLYDVYQERVTNFLEFLWEMGQEKSPKYASLAQSSNGGLEQDQLRTAYLLEEILCGYPSKDESP